MPTISSSSATQRLGIPHVSEATAKELARHFGKLDAMDATEDQLPEISDVGPIVAKSLRTFFSRQIAETRGVNFWRSVGKSRFCS